MITEYTFVLPIFVIWIIFYIIVLLVFFTSFGRRRLPVLNRYFLMRFIDLSLLVVTLAIMLSGLSRVIGFTLNVPYYFHALAGYLFALFGFTHITIHLRVVYRYVFKRTMSKSSKILLAIIIILIIIGVIIIIV